MNKGTQATQRAAERAWSLLEDYSPYMMRGWPAEQVESAIKYFRNQAYAMVSTRSRDASVQTCAHCVGVMLYCQYRGFGCAKEDFTSGGEANPLLIKTGMAAKLGSKVASLVAGLSHQYRGDHSGAIYHWDQCKSLPMANVMRGDSHCTLQQMTEGYQAYEVAAKQKHILGIAGVAELLNKGWGCKLDKEKGARLLQEAWKAGYWRIFDAYYEGIIPPKRKVVAPSEGSDSGHNTRSTASQIQSQPSNLNAVPAPSPSTRTRPKRSGAGNEQHDDKSPKQCEKGAGESDRSSTRSRQRNGGAANEQEGDKSTAHDAVQTSIVGGGSTLRPLSMTKRTEPHYCTEPWQPPKTEYGTFTKTKNEMKRYRDAVCGALRLRWVHMHDDGDCFFASVSKAMACLCKPMEVSARDLRTRVCAWLGKEYVKEYGADGVWVQGPS